MRLYPALQAVMGSWRYYIVKMEMKDLAAEVKFAAEVYDEKTLDDAIQRQLNDKRVKKEIVTFLKRRDDRFFASVVVAAIGGSPKFFPVRVSDDPAFAIFQDDEIDQPFGFLRFTTEPAYYALDGQHRLKAIKTLLDDDDPLSQGRPEGFEKEEISVLMVLKREEPLSTFLQSYRRLFSSLNRYAKPTDADTNIIMDEDDVIAILTRRIISEHPLFQWERGTELAKVKTKGKNIRSTETYLTSLQTLYYMNELLLSSADRENCWRSNEDEEAMDLKSFKRFRPDEDFIDGLFDELSVYWNAIQEVFPVLKDNPQRHRVHNRAEETEGVEEDDLLLFWPIGQEIFAETVRSILNTRCESKSLEVSNVVKALSPLKEIPWDLHDVPWKYILVTRTDEGWKMRSEDRTAAQILASKLLKWIVGSAPASEVFENELCKEWKERLLLPIGESNSDKEIGRMWDEIRRLREKILSVSGWESA